MAKVEFIDEQTAADMLGLKPLTLRMYCRDPKRKKYNILTSKVSKTKFYYNKVDILTEIKMRAKPF